MTNSLSVGSTNVAPAASSVVDIRSTSKGILLPRMSHAQVIGITVPTEGLIAYDTTNHNLLIYNGSAWASVGGGTDITTLPLTLGTAPTSYITLSNAGGGTTTIGGNIATNLNTAILTFNVDSQFDVKGTGAGPAGIGLWDTAGTEAVRLNAQTTMSAGYDFNLPSAPAANTSQVLKVTGRSAGSTTTAFAQLACADLSNGAASCSTDTTNAANISTGTLPAARLPNPTSSTLGGVESLAAISHDFLTSISTSGVPTQARPACADLSDGTSSCNTANASANTVSTLVARDGSGNFSAGTITAALTGNASTATALAANPADCSAGQYATTIAANGDLTCAQVAYSQVSGTPSLFSSPMTTLGDVMYEDASPTAARLAGNTTSTKKFLTQTGTGTISAVPAWATIAAGDVPTLNQNTSGTAAAWTTARNLAGNSVDGTANVAFANKFVVQGTTDAGLSGAQFLGALGTGIVKNTTTTGVLSIAVAGDFPTLNQSTTGTASNVTGTVAIGNGGTGQTTAVAAFDALSPLTTAGDALGFGSGHNVRIAGGTLGYFFTSGGGTVQNSWTNEGSLLTNINASNVLTGTLAVARGGTGLASGTSGGVLAYTASGTLASSGALTQHALVLGGGAGAAPTVDGSLGTTTTLLHGAAAGDPTWSAVSMTADVTGVLPIANGGTNVNAVTVAPAATAFAGWDANKNLSANTFIPGFTSTATAASTTTMTIASTQTQYWTGTTTQTVKLPTTSVVAGLQYLIVNLSTGAVTVQSSGANSIQVLAAGTSGLFTSLVATPTAAADWNVSYYANGTVPVTLGGTGQTSFTDGQLLIGNTTGNTLAVNTLNAGTGITVTNGHGTISIATTGVAATSLNFRSLSTTATAVAGDYIVASGASWTLTLPTAVGVSGQTIVVQHNGTSLTNKYTLNTTSSQTVGTNCATTGAACASGAYILTTNGESVTLISDNANWQVINHIAQTPSVAYTPTLSAGWTVTGGTNKFTWERHGHLMKVVGSFTYSASSATISSVALPSNAVIDTTGLLANASNAPGPVVGTIMSNFSGSALGGAMVLALGTSTSLVYGGNPNSAGTITTPQTASAGNCGSSAQVCMVKFEVPVSDWQP